MGYLRKHGAGWQYAVCTGKDPQTGKWKYKYGTCKSNTEAKNKMKELEVKVSKNQYFETEEMTVKEYLDHWLETYADINVAPSTYKRYKEFCNTIDKHLGLCQLEQLKPMHIQKFYSTLMRSKLSNSTILKIHRMFRMALKHGVGWQMLYTNPTDSVIPPKAEKTEMTVWDIDTINAFLEKIKDEVIYMPVVIAIQTGMREGEICALKWSSINLDQKFLSVKHTLQKNKEGILELSKPKTQKSKRTIELMEDTIKELKRHRNEQRLNKRILGDEYIDEDYVCCWTDGTHLNPHYVCKRFAALVKKYEFPKIRFHDLRHSHATLLLQEKTPAKVVSERLGHSSIVITMDTYSHVLPNMQKEAVQKLDSLFSQAR